MNEKIIYETKNFKVCIPNKPHVSREDGGHIRIKPIINEYESRLDLPINEAIERVNYQDNGNWAFLKNKKPHFHIHLYGRTRNSKVQPFGESLFFPNPETDFYDNFEPFNEEDILEIKNEIKILEKNDKYLNENWNI